MTEAFVTLETAKMLKEKGFMEDCMAFYTKNVLFKCNAYINTNVLKLPAPTQSIAQKWLRETKNIHICVYNCACGYGYEIYQKYFDCQ